MNEITTTLTTKNESEEWNLLQRQCKAFIASGFLPDHVTKNCSMEQAIARALTIATKGKELGIPPLQAFSSISVIGGKPSLSAELMLALIYQRVPGAKITIKTPADRQNTECTVSMQRPGGESMDFRFTMEDAKRADLRGTGWQKYPASMLRARAISAGARAVFPDAIMGCYTPEEVGELAMDENKPPEPRHVALRVAENAVVTQVGDEAETFEQKADNAKETAQTLNRLTPKVNIPSQADYPRANPGWENEPVTEAQLRRLYAIGKRINYGHEELKGLAFDVFKKEHLEDLTKGEIQVLFTEMETDSGFISPAASVPHQE